MAPSELITTMQANAGYDLDGDVAAAKAFVRASRQFLATGMSEGEQHELRVKVDLDQIRKNLDDALAWLAAKGEVASDVGVSFINTNYR